MSEPNDKKQGQTFIEKKPKKDLKSLGALLKTKKGALIFVFVLLGTLLSLYFLYITFFRETNVLSAGCSRSYGLLNSSAQAIESNDVSALEGLQDDIKNTKNYDEDPNCLIPVFYYQTAILDYSEAQITYEKIVSSYDSKPIAKEYGKITTNLDDLGVILEGTRLRQEEFSESIITF